MKLYVTLFFILLGNHAIQSQCNPSGSLECDITPVLCSVEELNGFSCANIEMVNRTGPVPLCNGDGIPHNTSWWAFVADGSPISITIKFDTIDCKGGAVCPIKGIQAGILDDCGGNPIDCSSICQNSTFSLDFQSLNCHTYFLWIDGCCGDVCEFVLEVVGGSTPSMPRPLPRPKLIGDACPGGMATVCIDTLKEGCDLKRQWMIDGIINPEFNDMMCPALPIVENGFPMEVCVVFTIGNPNDPNTICDQELTCISIIPDTIKIINDGHVFICWEDYKGTIYKWRGGDIDSIYNDSIYIIRIKDDKTGCIVEYRADSITFLPPRAIKEVYHFFCDKSDLPIKTEDGQIWYDEVCGEEITWQDTTFYGCDTSYLLYISYFDPEVTLTQDCGECDGFITLKANIDYSPDCIQGQISWTGYWLNNLLDTIGKGEELMVEKEGAYYFVFDVKYVDVITQEEKECSIEGSPPWLIIVKDIEAPSPNLSGSPTVCESEINTYKIENQNNNGCEYRWFINPSDGTIITPNHKDSSTIEIQWSKNISNTAEICVAIKTDCGFSLDSCLDVNIVDAPRWEDVVFECDDKGESFRIHFTIIGGDINTTVIKDTSGWTWTGKLGNRTFRSHWINNGDGVSITIHDHNLCPSPRLDTFFICDPVAVEEINQSNILIYPNPAHNFIHITSNNFDNNLNKMNIRIFDIQGNKIPSPPKTDIDGGLKINVEKLVPGMYFIQLKRGDMNSVLRFIVL